MMHTQSLYREYGVSLTDKSMMPRMTNLLRQIDAGNRLPKEERAWLGTEAKGYFTEKLRETYHHLEAEFHADQYRSTQDPWSAINASGHYRKCNRSEKALELLDSLARDRLKHSKVKSAVLTTRGGVMRDLGRRSEAIQMGEKAHALMPRDYRPCTLLGAVHMEQHEFERAHEWYEKARERGAPEQSIDSELRSIFQRLDSNSREAMKRFLLAEDSHRYRWLNEKGHQKAPSSRKHRGGWIRSGTAGELAKSVPHQRRLRGRKDDQEASVSTLADANESRDWRIHAEFAQRLIGQARALYASEDLGLELSNTVYALNSTSIDLCPCSKPFRAATPVPTTPTSAIH